MVGLVKVGRLILFQQYTLNILLPKGRTLDLSALSQSVIEKLKNKMKYHVVLLFFLYLHHYDGSRTLT